MLVVVTGFQNLIHPSGFLNRLCFLTESSPGIKLGVGYQSVVLFVAPSKSEPQGIGFLFAGGNQFLSYSPLSLYASSTSRVSQGGFRTELEM